MSRYAICDNCGDKDDTSYQHGHPILSDGLLLQFRREDEFHCELELCEKCREQILESFPKLREAFDREVQP